MSSPVHDTRWARKEDHVHQAVFAAIDRIKGQSTDHETSIEEALALYGGRPIPGYTRKPALSLRRTQTNIIRRVVGALISETVQNKPRPMALTTGGDFALRKKAEKLTQWCDGLFHDTRFYDQTAPAVALDAILLGTGFAHVFVSGGKAHIERVFPSEIFVDEQDALYGTPRSLYRCKFIDRYQAVELWPEHKDAILGAPNPSNDWVSGRDTTSDQILVAEAWHLRSGPDADDGKHAIVINGEDLVVEPYELDRFPILKLCWEDPVLGYWGTGVAEILAGIQLSINHLNMRVEEALYMHGHAVLAIPRGANVVTSHITNGVGNIVQFDGPQPPTLLTGPTISAEIYQQRQWLLQTAFEEVGVSQLAVQSQKPAGLNSGRALRVFEDQGSKRFLRWHKQWEAFHVDLAEIAIALMSAASDEDASYEVVYRSKSGIEKIDWKSVDLSEDSYRLQVFPTSILPTTPAGKLATVDELVQSGMIDPEKAKELVDIPDLSAEMDALRAPLNAVRHALEEMLTGDDYVPPDPHMNLQLALSEAITAYNQHLFDNVPEARLDNLRQFIADVQDLLQPPEPTMPAPPPEMSMDPGMPPINTPPISA